MKGEDIGVVPHFFIQVYAIARSKQEGKIKDDQFGIELDGAYICKVKYY